MTKTSPRSRRRSELVEERQAQIAEHAFALFSAKGFERTTVREIADSVGISVGLIFNYFPSKAAILKYLFDGLHQQIEATFRPATFQVGADPRRALEQAVESWVTWVDQHHREVLFSYRESHSLPPSERRALETRELGVTDIVTSILSAGAEEGVWDPDHLSPKANAIMVLGHMWAFRHWAFAKHFELEEYIQFAKRLALQIMSAQTQSAVANGAPK
ncbi:hypothetical protein LCGC14_2459340 [marine sediment metagenome]|uniref:HTH tetR-type domain-containing protein n=1 Tax=marine sediment metagenome TaxID=412755 RepID=A0A0F9DQX4_9ZZZZ